ncbi:hypothetical protein [Sciscionella sediminilitoris]|uniref:hypothetical protein n=1 Tax=Sciscionella sediminilitoris TaxID=1445613 RepID=UPI0004DF0AFE|nr:hypothetical protein [Sciscionella sp. SE31]
MRWWNRRLGRDARQPGQDVPEPDVTPLAARFWRRWELLQPEVSAALGDGRPGRFENVLCEVVAELHPNLDFAVEQGQRAMYALVLTGKEDPALRPYTDAWKAAAPPDDHVWEYHDHVPPVPDPDGVTVNIGAHRIALADVRIAALIDETEGVVDVAVHHPLLGELSEASRANMTFLPLEATLGERRAAEYLGRVETALTEPRGAITLRALRELVDDLAERR